MRLYCGLVTSKKRFSNQEFLSSVREYLPLEAVAREIHANGKAGGRTRQWNLSDNTFYLFNAENIAAIGNAIQDLALEGANGRLLACIQDFANFEMHRERYCQLATTIDQVEVLAGGKTPPRIRRLSFIEDKQRLCKQYWAVLYEGRLRQALLICQQVKPAQILEEKEFLGFYTFNPALISRLRLEIMELVAGQSRALPEFARQQAIDRAFKQIKMEFAREKEALGEAVRRLQENDERYPVGHFLSDLEKGLLRLNQWKSRMPEIIARAEGQPRT